MNIFELFEKARQSLQYPRITYPLPNKDKIIFFPWDRKGPNVLGISNGKFYDNRVIYGEVHRTETGATIKWNEKIAPIPQDFRALCGEIVKDPLAKCKLQGIAFSFCCFCARMLTTKESLFVGYGPICAEKWGLPWGETAESKIDLENL